MVIQGTQTATHINAEDSFTSALTWKRGPDLEYHNMCPQANRGEEAVEDKYKASRGWFMRLWKEVISITSKCMVKQQVLIQKPQQIIQKIQLRELMKVPTVNNGFLM